MSRCKSKNKNGKACLGYAITGSQFCFTHDPTRAAERARAHKKGGTNRPRANEIPFPENLNVKTGEGLLVLMEQVMRDTWGLENSVARSRTLGYLAQIQKGVLAVGELEQRVAALEAILKQRNNEK